MTRAFIRNYRRNNATENSSEQIEETTKKRDTEEEMV